MRTQTQLFLFGIAVIIIIAMMGMVSAGCEGFYSCRSKGGILNYSVSTFEQDGKNYTTITTDACVFSYGVCRKDIYPFVQYTLKVKNTVNLTPIKSPRLDMRNATLLLGDTRCMQFANVYYPNPQVYRYNYTFQFANLGTFPLYIYTLDLISNHNCKDDLGRFDDKTVNITLAFPTPPVCSESDNYCSNGDVYNNQTPNGGLVAHCSYGCASGQCVIP